MLRLLFSLVFLAHASEIASSSGDCRQSDVPIDVPSHEDTVLSLMQRHARVAQNRTMKVAAAERGAHGANKSNATAPTSSKEAVSLLAFASDMGETAFDLQHIDLSYVRSMAGLSGVTIFTLIAVSTVLCCLFCSLRAQQSNDYETEGKPSPKGAFAPSPSATLPSAASQAPAAPVAATGMSPSGARTRLSPLASTRTPVQQQAKAPVCMLFPTLAADVKARNNSFQVFWGSLETAWFRMDVKEGGGQGDRLDVFEVHNGALLVATVYLNSDPGAGGGGSLWLITNKTLRASTRGLAYRSGKDNNKIRNAMASWGSTVHGVSQGDGWLKVGDWYLPMEVDGHETIVNVDTKDAAVHSGLEVMRPDGTPFATFKHMAGGQFAMVRNGATACIISIGTSGFLLEAKLPSGKRVATVAKEQVRVPSGEMMLELVVEPQMDPVTMLITAVAVLRQLPPH